MFLFQNDSRKQNILKINDAVGLKNSENHYTHAILVITKLKHSVLVYISIYLFGKVV